MMYCAIARQNLAGPHSIQSTAPYTPICRGCSLVANDVTIKLNAGSATATISSDCTTTVAEHCLRTRTQ